ncbi:ABC transporter substrate-binding protein [Acidimangrovimonas sediminis]|uniref:ABC transporter substrate-binding protein n=1 Tax=Acidimangrovimonas sediminis TaxID=2056283 RepID=UPI000C8095D0|nr:ABC transporter substrate-binding protein [Acidimangrovimonas sediminis]
MKTTFSLALAGMLLSTTAALADTTITIESWRNDDLTVWQQKIIPAFEKEHPDIKVKFVPSAPTEYNAALNSKLDAGTAGDLITCRPFDASLALFKKGQLADLSDMKIMSNFSDVAKAAWQTDDAKHTFCVPMASVIHGFIYNKDAFKDVGIDAAPKTVDEFYADLDKIKKDGSYTPLDMGTHDQWEAATMGYENIGPTYWDGEKGRKAVIAGTEKLTDPQFVEPFKQLVKWTDYMGDGYKAQTYPDSQNLFTLGRAAIYPAGSWEISVFEKQADFKMGAFPPPVQKAGDQCYISDQPDHALGLNAASKHKDAAMTFLKWVGSQEFAQIYGNALPGFFPLTKEKVTIKDPLANEFLSWRQSCKPTMRYTYQILSRGTPNLENALWAASANVMNKTETPEQAAEELQKGLASWYEPQQK